jgi:hypothetical protein
MSLADIDAAATRRRIQDIAEGARKAFEEHAQRSAELDAAAREAAAKEEADAKAVQDRRAEIEARKAAAPAEPKPKKPATLSLGAEEFKLDRQAREAAKQASAAQQAEPEQAAPAEPDKPVRKRQPRPDADDDMSGRTWLR